jgi:uncharacterized protein (TIGR02246 family)
MRTYILTLVILLLIQYSPSAFGQDTSDTLLIQQILETETEAWNKGDAKLFSKYFANDGTFTNVLGMFYIGHESFMQRHDEIFKGFFKGTHFKQSVVSLKFVCPGVAIVETLTCIGGFSSTGPPPGTYLNDDGYLYSRLLQVIVKMNDNWQVESFHNVDVKPAAFASTDSLN